MGLEVDNNGIGADAAVVTPQIFLPFFILLVKFKQSIQYTRDLFAGNGAQIDILTLIADQRRSLVVGAL